MQLLVYRFSESVDSYVTITIFWVKLSFRRLCSELRFSTHSLVVLSRLKARDDIFVLSVFQSD